MSSERHENAKEKREKKKKLISNTVQNALDKQTFM